MTQIFLIAWREYKQYILSRGFLLFLVMFPVALIAAAAALDLLEKNKPIRTFVVYDETSIYTEEIDREIEQRRFSSAIMAWDGYLRANAQLDQNSGKIIPAPFGPAPVHNRRVGEFIEAGGFGAAQIAAAPFLKPGAENFSMPRAAVQRLALPEEIAGAASLAEAEAGLRPYLLGERQIERPGQGGAQLFAALLIPKGFGAGKDAEAAQYWSRNLTDDSLEMLVTSALDTALRREIITGHGLPQETLDDVAAIHAPLNSYRPDRAAEDAQLDFQDRIETILPALLTYMLLVIIFGVGNLLLTNTIEERSNKIVEILLSSVTADQLMIGKLLGIAAVGLTMPTIFLFGGVAVSSTVTVGGNNMMDLALTSLFSSPLLLIYLFYFLCAYAIFAMIFLAIGAVSNSLQDAQSYMGPVMLLVFAPLPFMPMVFQNPNGVVASLLTWIPVYTPYAVMMRAAADPPIWEIIGATALMLAFAIFLARIMGRIFRQAILQASPPKMRDVWRLARSETG